VLLLFLLPSESSPALGLPFSRGKCDFRLFISKASFLRVFLLFVRRYDSPFFCLPTKMLPGGKPPIGTLVYPQTTSATYTLVTPKHPLRFTVNYPNKPWLPGNIKTASSSETSDLPFVDLALYELGQQSKCMIGKQCHVHTLNSFHNSPSFPHLWPSHSWIPCLPSIGPAFIATFCFFSRRGLVDRGTDSF